MFVGGVSAIEVDERKARLEDALHAARAASQEGTLPGAGRALQYISSIWSVDEPRSASWVAGYRAMYESAAVPMASIISNSSCDVDPAVVAHRLASLKFNDCFDAKSGRVVDSYESGILDPAQVTRVSTGALLHKT